MQCLDCQRERADLVATRMNGKRLGGEASDTKGGREDEDEERRWGRGV